VHIDGDGFASRTELPGTPYAGEAMLRELLEKYRVPTTVSVIQGEIAPDGLYPKDSPALEAIAKRIFALPHVEIASHSYSHPFFWQRLEKDRKSSTAEPYNLTLPGYRFSIEAEVNGSLVCSSGPATAIPVRTPSSRQFRQACST
jgi:polysaccharide biosynthesis protein PelA